MLLQVVTLTLSSASSKNTDVIRLVWMIIMQHHYNIAALYEHLYTYTSSDRKRVRLISKLILAATSCHIDTIEIILKHPLLDCYN